MQTTITLIQKVVNVYYACPHCGCIVCQALEEFESEQGLDFQDFPDWEYEKIICPTCEQEIEPIFDFD